MIELPECYVLARQINQALVGKRVVSVTPNAHPHGFATFSGDPSSYPHMLVGRQITAAYPGTGYTCGGNTEIRFDDTVMVFSTALRYTEQGSKLPAKHQVLIEFDDGSHLSATVQMWGSMFCFPEGEDGFPEGWVYKKCPDPLTDGFDEAYYMSLYDGLPDRYSVKAFVATEQRIPGVGNGVLQDILYNAKLHPKRRLSTLTDADKSNLYHALKVTLRDMERLGGRDTERDLFGKAGGYKTRLSKLTLNYPCPECGGTIERQAFLGGNIYLCPKCQV